MKISEQASRPSIGSGIARLYRTMWRSAEGRRPQVILFLALLIVAQLVRLAIPFFFGQAINALQTEGSQDIATAANYAALMLGASLLAWLLHGPGRVLERWVALALRERFADSLYAKAVALPMRWHESHHSGDTIQRMQKSTAALYGFSQNQFIYLQNAVNLFGPLIALFFISSWVGAVALAGYALIGLVLVKFDAAMVRLALQENRADGRYLAELVDCLGNISTVLTLRLGQATRSTIARRLAEVGIPIRRTIVVNEAKWAAIDLLNNLMLVGLVSFFAWLSWSAGGLILIGSALMVHQYSSQLSGVVGAMATNWQALVRYQADIASADELVTAAEKPQAAGAVPPDWREIRIDNLCFSHAAARGERPSLEHVGLTLRRGGRVALVGESGSGKSTLMRVLTGLYEADRATIEIDGVVQFGLKDLGSLATLVPQDPEIFESTIGQNITMGVDYPAADVERACSLAVLEPVLAQCPEGLDTAINERGVNMSGGQKQRLALARGILASRDASVILLDESTSSLDPVTEARIYAGLLTEFPDACVIASVHRLHLLASFETVVLMDGGRVVDSGSLHELMARQPRFQEMWRRYVGAAQVGGERVPA